MQAEVNTLACVGHFALQGAHVVGPLTVVSIRRRILQTRDKKRALLEEFSRPIQDETPSLMAKRVNSHSLSGELIEPLQPQNGVTLLTRLCTLGTSSRNSLHVAEFPLNTSMSKKSLRTSWSQQFGPPLNRKPRDQMG